MKKEKPTFDFKTFEEEAIKSIREGKPLEGKDGVLISHVSHLISHVSRLTSNISNLPSKVSIIHKRKRTHSIPKEARPNNPP